jgi:hypothetical protein
MSCRTLGLMTAAALALTGCEAPAASQVTLQEKLLPHPNPTNYVFDASVSEVKNAVKRGYEKWRDEQREKYADKVWKGAGGTKGKHLLTLALQLSGLTQFLWKGDGDALAKGILTKPGNENDAYIYGGDTPVGESQVYFKDGQPLIYYADFHIHLSAVGPQKTQVDIYTYDSSLVTGVDESWSPHGPSFISVSVPPTTIEEYRILLGIGEKLGTKSMPRLVTPGWDSPVKLLTKTRER